MYVENPSLSGVPESSTCDVMMVPEEVRECLRAEGREQMQRRVDWPNIIAGAAAGLLVTVVGNYLLRR